MGARRDGLAAGALDGALYALGGDHGAARPVTGVRQRTWSGSGIKLSAPIKRQEFFRLMRAAYTTTSPKHT